MQYKMSFESENVITEFIKQIFHKLKQTLVEDNIRGGFMMVEFYFNVSVELYTLLFGEQKLRKMIVSTNSEPAMSPWRVRRTE